MLRSENATAVHYINNMGSQKLPACNKIAKDIWKLCQEFNVGIEASFIAGKNNGQSGKLSILHYYAELSLCSTYMNIFLTL